MREAARRCGVAVGTLYNYFPSKDALAAAVMLEDWHEDLDAMCFAAAGKKPVIKHAPPFLFDILAAVNRRKKNGKEAIIRFSKWTLSQPMVGETKAGEHSFAEYIKNSFKEG